MSELIDFRAWAKDLTYPWAEPDFSAVRPPFDDYIVNDDRAAAFLGISTAELFQWRARLKLPRIERNKWSLFQLEIWRRVNDPLRFVGLEALGRKP